MRFQQRNRFHSASLCCTTFGVIEVYQWRFSSGFQPEPTRRVSLGTARSHALGVS
jgi:hypothetical protein